MKAVPQLFRLFI